MSELEDDQIGDCQAGDCLIYLPNTRDHSAIIPNQANHKSRESRIKAWDKVNQDLGQGESGSGAMGSAGIEAGKAQANIYISILYLNIT